jgi:hypothetical protein
MSTPATRAETFQREIVTTAERNKFARIGCIILKHQQRDLLI